MEQGGFIRNTWYVAGWSKDFVQALAPVRILGEDIVIYRTGDGTPVALEDACPHRKLPLSKGNLLGDRVECGYHGLTFDGTGACVRAPTQEGMIPKNARVHSYRVVDRYDLLWIWMGDQAKADPGKIYTIENFDNPAWGKTPGGALDIACHYLWIIDNLLDPSHVAWVHLSSFAGAGTDDGALEVDVLENGVLVYRWIYDCAPPPYYTDLVNFNGNADRLQHYECQLPSIAINKSLYTPAGTGGPDKPLVDNAYINISYNFMTPVDENNSRYYWFQHRNTDPDNQEISEKMFAGAKMAFEEDREVLTYVHAGMANPKTPAINLGLDAGAARFRRLVERQIEAESAAKCANGATIGTL
ncbi:MAG: aromatic ring-hydroxylating dioxygenase subunit alpha [Rhizobiales bacterium]|nr:aromatic ring-hydroxylating dioxygenase subunit alpha [Hyphomicrobiales bacterium]